MRKKTFAVWATDLSFALHNMDGLDAEKQGGGRAQDRQLLTRGAMALRATRDEEEEEF